MNLEEHLRIATLALLASGVAVASPAETAADRKPNILIVFADQLRAMELGCYGAKQIPTPNMDRLASEGLRLTHAISTLRCCWPRQATPSTPRRSMTGFFRRTRPIRW